MLIECTKCHRKLPSDQFHKEPRKKNGLRSWCKDCSRREAARSKRARDVDMYFSIVSIVGEVCGICGIGPQPGRRLCIDHDWLTGEIRGLLCDPHNRALGAFGDCEEGLELALAYLRRNRVQSI